MIEEAARTITRVKWRGDVVLTLGEFGAVVFRKGGGPPIEVPALPVSRVDATGAGDAFAGIFLSLWLHGRPLVLSDIGANSLLLPPAVWLQGKPVANRLKIIREWTKAGGGLVMAGGYFSFQGIDGKARWRRTPVEEALPVTCLPYDDRLEVPDGFKAVVTGPKNHPILAGIEGEWPLLLGANEVVVKEGDGVEVLARLPEEEGGHPLLVTGSYGKGRTVAWTSDIGPHWVPNEFVAWAGYATIWKNILRWASQTN